ncbi:hypothetical protein EDD22DRAFT_846474 [Suillus occidentalis]|nr:hypothetical protein EDD22DRAFT_846474 [Suillus occidentalis]
MPLDINCMIHHSKAHCSTSGCTPRRMSCLRLPGLNYAISLYLVMKHYLTKALRVVGHVNHSHVTNNYILPHGVPNLIYKSSEEFGAMDFKVTIDQDGIDHLPQMVDNNMNEDHCTRRTRTWYIFEGDELDVSLLLNEQVTKEEGLFAWFSDEEEEEEEEEEDETHEW